MGKERVLRKVRFPFPVHAKTESEMRLISFWEESRSWSMGESMAAYRRRSVQIHGAVGLVGSVSWTRELGLALSFRNNVLRSKCTR